MSVTVSTRTTRSSAETGLPERTPGWTLPQAYFNSPDIYQRDLDAIWRTGWLFAGHTCELPRTGDYFLLEVDTDSIIVLRGNDGTIHALHNVCRHRGSVLCTEPCGQVTKLVCPYHQWAYDLDGRLVAWRGMQPELKKEDFPLHRLAVEEVEGLIFLSLSPRPLPFTAARACLGPLAQPQGLRRAKVAKAVDYLVNANWKVVWENNRECYHCNVNHPQYIKANFDHFNTDDTPPRIREEINSVVQRSEQKWSVEGFAATHTDTGMTRFPDAARGIWFSANRTPLVDGWVSETMDGQQVAPLMGDYRDADVGTLRMRALPNFWNHSSCDHAVSTRLLPAGPQRTAIRVWWLVEEKAVEGRDYDLAKLMPFWQLTSEQDWLICERQQKGINSTAYRPGPYSTFKEYNVEGFVQWYVESVRRYCG